MVSIVIPAYNAAPWLAQCLESAVTQLPPEQWEAVVVNDGSTDATAQIAQGYAQRYPQIKVVTQENQGLSAARNAGIEAGKGEWLTFLDADDTLMPGALKRLLSHAGDCDAVFGAIKERKVTPPATTLEEILYRSGNRGSACGKLFRRDFLGKLRFKPGMMYEDIDFLGRFFRLNPRVVSAGNDPIYLYRVNPKSFLSQFSSRRLDVLQVTRELEERWGDTPRVFKAARNRRFAACYNILSLLYSTGATGYEQAWQECHDIIYSRRLEVLFDPRSRLKVRLGAIGSFFGKGAIKVAAKRYKGR